MLASHDWSTGENRLGAVQNLMPTPCLVLRILPSWFVYMPWTTNNKNPYELDIQITSNRHMSYKGEHKLVNYRGLKSRLPVWLLTSHLLHVPGAKKWQVINSDLNSSVDLFSMAHHKQYWLVMLLFRKISSTYYVYWFKCVMIYLHLYTIAYYCTGISKSQFLKHEIYLLYNRISQKTMCVTTVQIWPTLKGIQRQGNLIGTWACCPWLLKGLKGSVVRARNRPRSPTLLTRYAAFRTFGAIFKIGSVQLRRWSPEQFSWFKQFDNWHEINTLLTWKS